jgi:hypothetical protein
VLRLLWGVERDGAVECHARLADPLFRAAASEAGEILEVLVAEKGYRAMEVM